jgi:hypothetical protein
MWRDPSTPTRAQTADAVMKLASTEVGGIPILPLEMAREEIGWSPVKRERARLLDVQYQAAQAKAQAEALAQQQALAAATPGSTPAKITTGAPAPTGVAAVNEAEITP